MAGSLPTSESQQQLVGRPSKSKLLPTPVTVSGMSAISSVWILLTFIVTAALVVAAGFPQWVHNHDPQQLGNLVSRADVGLYHFCYNQTGRPEFRECVPYLQFTPAADSQLEGASLRDIAFLFSSSVVYAFGVGMLFISLIIGGVAYCKPRIKKLSMFLVAFFFQMAAGDRESCSCVILKCMVLHTGKFFIRDGGPQLA